MTWPAHLSCSSQLENVELIAAAPLQRSDVPSAAYRLLARGMSACASRRREVGHDRAAGVGRSQSGDGATRRPSTWPPLTRRAPSLC